MLSSEPLDIPDDYRGPITVAHELSGDDVSWAYPAASSAPDPTVSVYGAGPEPIDEHEPLSGFLIQLALFETITTMAPYRAGARQLPAAAAARITGSLNQVPLRPLRWPHDPTSFYVGPGIIAMVTAADGGYPQADGTVSVHVGCRDRAVLRPLVDAGVEWDVLDY
ncbi:hypothetical protein AB0M36_37545 [Actinoplanes sp. NPDC051346]|uniref:hypothetical protein n=1 Tax=Actinoplanes sp. NPDC051346 TaxID=3155048 RepID=UPI00344ADF75